MKKKQHSYLLSIKYCYTFTRILQHKSPRNKHLDMKFPALKKIFGLAIFSLVLISVAFTISCKKSIGGITRDTPPLPSGNQYLVVSALTTDNSAIPAYTLTIEAPDGNISTESSAEADFIIDPIQTGTYVIAITGVGYIGQTKRVDVMVPTEKSDDYLVGLALILTKKNPPVTINHATGGTINVPPMGTGAGGIGSDITKVIIPPGAIDDAGSTSTDISITPIPSNQETSANGLQGVTYVFDPDITFTTPVTVEIPLGFPQSVAQNNIPVVFEQQDGQDEEEIVLSANGAIGNVQMSHFSTWTIVLGVTLNVSATVQSQGIQGVCSGALNDPFSFTGSYGPILSNLFQIPALLRTVTINGTFTKPSVLYFILSGTATAPMINYQLLLPSSVVLEQRSNIPVCAFCYSVKYFSQACHDSGG